MDVVGTQQGANYWAALRVLMGDLLEGFWSRVSWARHSCDICLQILMVNGQQRSIKAGVSDGCTNTRHAACGVPECPHDLPDIGGSRRVVERRSSRCLIPGFPWYEMLLPYQQLSLR